MKCLYCDHKDSEDKPDLPSNRFFKLVGAYGMVQERHAIDDPNPLENKVDLYGCPKCKRTFLGENNG